MSQNGFQDGTGHPAGPAAGKEGPGASAGGPAGPAAARPALLARAPQPLTDSGDAERPASRKLAPAAPSGTAAPLAPMPKPPAPPMPATAKPAAPSPVAPSPVAPSPVAAVPVAAAPAAAPPAAPSVAAPPPAAAPPTAAPPIAAPPTAAPIDAFLSPGRDHRLRDLLAFGMAVEGGKAATPETVDAMRRQADAELEAYAFRSLHNRVEEIRRAAIDEHLAKLRQTPGFQGIVVANLVAMIAAALLGLLFWWLHAVFSMGS